MGLKDEYQECKKLVLEVLNFDMFEDDESFNHFEITIRVLGGLLGAYTVDPDVRYLTKAIDLGDRLLGEGII